jgi:catechol 2,3-dioxygenase-like lactoylglutathione lyase family enzyme
MKHEAMKSLFATALAVIGVTIAGITIGNIAQAQGPGREQAPAPRPLVGETMPVGGDMAKTIHFYHDLLGLECRSGDPRVRTTWYDTRPFLEDMYGAVGGPLRNVTFLTPASPFMMGGQEMAIEPIEWKNAKGKPLNLKPQDPGATLMIFHVTDIDRVTGYLKQGGAKVVTTGGAPVAVGVNRSIVFDDGNGFFVELVQPAKLPEQLAPQAANAPRSFVYGLDTTVTVADIDKSVQFFRDVMGLNVNVDPSFHADAKRLQALGMKSAQYREAAIAWPDRTPQLNLVQYKGVEQKTLTPLVADPNATIMRIFVSDMVPVLAKVKANPEAKIMNVSGAPVTGNGRPESPQWLMIRLPGGSTYLQIIGLPNGRIG